MNDIGEVMGSIRSSNNVEIELVDVPNDIAPDKLAEMIKVMHEETDEWMVPTRKQLEAMNEKFDKGKMVKDL